MLKILLLTQSVRIVTLVTFSSFMFVFIPFFYIAEEDAIVEAIEDASETVVDDVAERVYLVIVRIEKEVIKEKLGVDIEVDNDVEIVVANIDANDPRTERNDNGKYNE